jgi:hypothetical protein
VLVGIIVLLTVFNVTRSALIPSGVHFVANVALGLAVLGIGLAAGMTGAEIGASHEHLAAGLRSLRPCPSRPATSTTSAPA